MSAALRICALACVVALACGGERGEAPAGPPQPSPEAVTKVSENGPVKATVKVWPPAPQLGDPLYLQLTIEAGAGVTVAAPFEDEGLGRFAALDWKRDTKRRPDGGSVEIQTYTLEAPGSGKHRIPPFRLLVTDQAESELLTEEIAITVAPVDPSRAGEALAPPRPALPLRVGGWPLWAFVALGAVTVGMVVGAVVIIRSLRHGVVVRARVSAYELAVRRLAALERGGAPDDVAADGWFVELSAIVRYYVEARFALRAPELTTEEFLQVARRAPELSTQHREMLTSFLERCDRVKFAGYRPDGDESMATLAAARAFVEDTRHREAA
jgi:hypothetical protein